MKKLVLLSALLAAAGVANAQSSVSLYGRLDTGVRTVDGHKDGNTTSLWHSALGGSRWGIEGSEDLGSGTKSSFRLESSITPTTGAAGSTPAASFFDRQSWISLSNKDWGTLRLGRDNTFGLDALFSGVLDTAGLLDGVGSNATKVTAPDQNTLTSAYDPNPLTSFYSTTRDTRRLNNFIKYTHNINGLNFGFGYALGGVAGNSKTGSTLNYSLGYTQGQLATISTYQTTYDAANKKMDVWNIGAKYNFGQFAILAAYHELKADAGYTASLTSDKYFKYVLTGTTGTDATQGKVVIANTGLVYNFAPQWTYTLAYYNVDQKEGIRRGKVNSAITHLQYDLSKRTSLYGIVDYQKAGAGFSNATGYKNNQTGFTAGMRHIF
jgi:predicted porin